MEWLALLTPWHWLTAAVIIIVVEMLMGTYYLLWVGFAAAITALIQWIFGIDWQAQVIVFFIFSLISIVAWHYYSKNNPEVDAMPNLNKRGRDRKSTRLKSSHITSSYAVFCLKKKNNKKKKYITKRDVY